MSLCYSDLYRVNIAKRIFILSQVSTAGFGPMQKKQILDKLSGKEADEQEDVDRARRSVLGGVAVSGLAAVRTGGTDARSEPEPIAFDEARSIIQQRRDAVEHLEQFENFVEAARDVDDRLAQFAEKAQRQELPDSEGNVKEFAVATLDSSSGEVEVGFSRDDGEVFVRFSSEERGEEFRSSWNEKHRAEDVTAEEICGPLDCSGTCSVNSCDCCSDGLGYCTCDCANVLPGGDCDTAFRLCTCCDAHAWCADGCTSPPYGNC